MKFGTDNDMLFSKYKLTLKTIDKLDQLDKLMGELYFDHDDILSHSDDFSNSFSLVYNQITEIMVNLTKDNNLRLKKLNLIK